MTQEQLIFMIKELVTQVTISYLHQMPLLISGTEKPFMILEPPAYGVHLVGPTGAVSHVGYVDPFPTPQKPGGDTNRDSL